LNCGKIIGGVRQELWVYSSYIITNFLLFNEPNISYYNYFFGCSIKVNQAIAYSKPWTGELGTVQFVNCLISTTTYYFVDSGATSITDLFFNHCAMDVRNPSTAYHLNFIDTQLGWVCNNWPTTAGSYEDFAESKLLFGVITPPIPGLLPYTDHEINIWDEQRDNIGATSKYAKPAPIPPTIYATIGAGGDYPTINQALNALRAASPLASNYIFTLITGTLEVIPYGGGTINIGSNNVIFRNPSKFDCILDESIEINILSTTGKFFFNGYRLIVSGAIIPANPTAIITIHQTNNTGMLIVSNNRINCLDRWNYGISTLVISVVGGRIKCFNNIISRALVYGINNFMA
jgi:hypothetical protein